MKALHLTPEGGVFPLVPANGTDFTLSEAQAVVGGLIEIHALSDEDIMVINEEGRLLKLPLNPRASLLLGTAVAGPALVCHTGMIK